MLKDLFKPPQCTKYNLKGDLSVLSPVDFKNCEEKGGSLLQLTVICEMSSLLWYCIYLTMSYSMFTVFTISNLNHLQSSHNYLHSSNFVLSTGLYLLASTIQCSKIHKYSALFYNTILIWPNKKFLEVH